MGDYCYDDDFACVQRLLQEILDINCNIDKNIKILVDNFCEKNEVEDNGIYE